MYTITVDEFVRTNCVLNRFSPDCIRMLSSAHYSAVSGRPLPCLLQGTKLVETPQRIVATTGYVTLQ